MPERSAGGDIDDVDRGQADRAAGRDQLELVLRSVIPARDQTGHDPEGERDAEVKQRREHDVGEPERVGVTGRETKRSRTNSAAISASVAATPAR